MAIPMSNSEPFPGVKASHPYCSAEFIRDITEPPIGFQIASPSVQFTPPLPPEWSGVIWRNSNGGHTFFMTARHSDGPEVQSHARKWEKAGTYLQERRRLQASILNSYLFASVAVLYDTSYLMAKPEPIRPPLKGLSYQLFLPIQVKEEVARHLKDNHKHDAAARARGHICELLRDP